MLMVSAAFLFGIEVDFLISPYKGTFRVSQAYRNLRANGTYHQGYDLVGIGDKSIYCPVYGTVIRAGWECATLPKKGFGQRVVVRIGSTAYYMYERYEYCYRLYRDSDYGSSVRRGDSLRL